MAAGAGYATTRFYTGSFLLVLKVGLLKDRFIHGVLSLVLKSVIIGAHGQGIRLHYVFNDYISFVLLSNPSTHQEVSGCKILPLLP